MSDKLTDNEIIKALECCIKDNCDCSECPAIGVCQHDPDCPKTIALDLINRQKADIKKLTSGKCVYLSDDETTEYCVEGPCPNYKTEAEVKAEAVKEFAENAVKRVEKAKLKYQKLCKEQGEEMEEHMHIHFNGIIGIINNLLKELVGENNETKTF